MSILKIGSGRKKESAVWNHFSYDASTDKSTCKLCSVNLNGPVYLRGSNPTNLKAHLRSLHSSVSKEVDRLDSEAKLKLVKLENNSHQTSVSSTVGSSTQVSRATMDKFLAKEKRQHWPVHSKESAIRKTRLIELFSAACLPTRLVDLPEFRLYVQTLDPKCQLPRKFTLLFQLLFWFVFTLKIYDYGACFACLKPNLKMSSLSLLVTK
jgi:hypothetical protein